MRMIGFINLTLREIETDLLASEEIDFVCVRSVAELRDQVAGAEAALVGNSTYDSAVAEILRSTDSLRWIQATSIGIDSLVSHRPRSDIRPATASAILPLLTCLTVASDEFILFGTLQTQ